MGTDDSENTHGRWSTQRTIACVLGLVLFAITFWIESPPPFLVHAGWPSWVFAIALWLGELLAYAIGIAGILVLFVFLGSHVWYLLRNARRWFRLQEIRSWRAKRACNERSNEER
jgi:hypothetical protein